MTGSRLSAWIERFSDITLFLEREDTEVAERVGSTLLSLDSEERVCSTFLKVAERVGSTLAEQKGSTLLSLDSEERVGSTFLKVAEHKGSTLVSLDIEERVGSTFLKVAEHEGSTRFSLDRSLVYLFVTEHVSEPRRGYLPGSPCRTGSLLGTLLRKKTEKDDG